MGEGDARGALERELSRRDFITRGSAFGAAALVLSALPAAERMIGAEPAAAAVLPNDATLQAFADTLIPGRPATRTDLGDEIHPQAIAGVDPEPGAVEADVLRVYKHPLIGFTLLSPVFLADLTARTLAVAGDARPFLLLPYEQRAKVVLSGLAFDNPDRIVWEAAAAVPFTAFCAATIHPVGTSQNCSGYRVMGYPGAAPDGYSDYSYRRVLARERTSTGSLP